MDSQQKTPSLKRKQPLETDGSKQTEENNKKSHIHVINPEPNSADDLHAVDFNKKQQNLEYVIEKLGFEPSDFIDEVVNRINTMIYEAIFKFEQDLIKLFKQKAEGEVKQGVHKIQTFLESRIDYYFDLFEIFLNRNIFTILKIEHPKELINSDNDSVIVKNDCKVENIDKEIINARNDLLQV